VQVDTSGDPVILNMGNVIQRVFFGTPPIEANTTFELADDTNALVFWFTFLCDQDIQIQMPASFNMDVADAQWDGNSKIWTALGVGPTQYLMTAVYATTDTWMVTITGPKN
jgi:hypothetical protein